MNRFFFTLVTFFTTVPQLFAQGVLHNPKASHANKFEQLEREFPSPNVYRSASGRPGPLYWQQQADYKIKAYLDTKTQRIDGEEEIVYHNQSPDTLAYLWIHLDENKHQPNSVKHLSETGTAKRLNPQTVKQLFQPDAKSYGINILEVTDLKGNVLSYKIVGTLMRVDLKSAILPKSAFSFKIKWWHHLVDRNHFDSRSGFEFFPDDKSYQYTATQWFPRLAMYSDTQGWHINQFLGVGEFALNFGNYEVSINVPADHIVTATGECQNYTDVLTATQLERLKKAKQANEPVQIITLEEAIKNTGQTATNARKVWHFKANNVRDFAWGASKRLAWDGMKADIPNGKPVFVMSLYGKEAYPLFNRYSSKLVVHTLKNYSKHTFPYPYPVAISVEANNEMEYPMIAFNTGRADQNGNYTEAQRDYMSWIIIHETGHFFFPMVVNSDERQWSFMDEGTNTFLQYLTENKWYSEFPSVRGPAYKITNYMKRPKEQLEPILTNSENIRDFYTNQYSKTTTGLNILRETILGPELFDYAFKEYANRWAFKHPTPYDFFRSMEDASGIDLDWFWRGWYLSTDAVDIAFKEAKAFQVDSKNYTLSELASGQLLQENTEGYIFKGNPYVLAQSSAVEQDVTLQDKYYKERIKEKNNRSVAKQQPAQYKDPGTAPKYVYELTFDNKGGLVMPILLKWIYTDGTEEMEQLPVQIWKLNEKTVRKTFPKQKMAKAVIIDPYSQTADIDVKNNVWVF